MSLGGGRARRLSLGSAITFAVAAVASVVGGRVTDSITPALVIFAGLVITGMLLTYWLDRSTRAAGPDGDGHNDSVTRPQLSGLRGSQQNIIAAAPGSIAQGAIGGNVVNHEKAVRPEVPAESVRPTHSEEQGGRS
jgi:hypothetical protein